ncbi:MAG: ubiquitin-conjugating enzyme E2 [Thermomicrobiales bacterium]
MSATDPRIRRLETERERLIAWCAERPNAVTLVNVDGTPPQRYTLRFRCISPAELTENSPRLAQMQQFTFILPGQFPMKAPVVTVTTPVVHPNIWVSGQVCLGNFWNPSITLDQLAAQMWRILVWDPSVINPDSAANGVAAHWYRSQRDHVAYDRVDPSLPKNEPEPEQSPEPPKPRISWS